MANKISLVIVSLLITSFLLPSTSTTTTTTTTTSSLRTGVLRELRRPHWKSPPIDFIFQFGDSLSDTGNLIRDGPIGAHNPCGCPPYGETLHKTTGRCSDGLLMIDYFAKFFQLPLLSPYLNKEGNFRHGVNFAVAGSTALDMSGLADRGVISPVTNSSLSVQMKWFNDHLNSKCHDSSDCKKKILHKSLVLMGEVGGNDYNYALLEGKTMDELRNLVPVVVQSAIKEAVKEVVNLGATKVVVPGNFPIGCMPIYLSLFQSNDTSRYDELGCLKDLNEFAKYHNDQLQEAIKELQQAYPNAAIVYGDYYSGLRWILSGARALGFNEIDLQKACCGMDDNKYNFDMKRLCGGEGVPVCENPSERFSWDGIHLTQHAYSLLANYLLRRSVVPIILGKV